jgi:hypothetical protein
MAILAHNDVRKGQLSDIKLGLGKIGAEIAIVI